MAKFLCIMQIRRVARYSEIGTRSKRKCITERKMRWSPVTLDNLEGRAVFRLFTVRNSQPSCLHLQRPGPVKARASALCEPHTFAAHKGPSNKILCGGFRLVSDWFRASVLCEPPRTIGFACRLVDAPNWARRK